MALGDIHVFAYFLRMKFGCVWIFYIQIFDRLRMAGMVGLQIGQCIFFFSLPPDYQNTSILRKAQGEKMKV